MRASALGASARSEEYGRSETRQGATHPALGGPSAAGASRGAWCLADGSVDKLVHDVEVRPDPGRLKRPRAAVDAAPVQGRPRESTGDAGGVQGEPKPARMRRECVVVSIIGSMYLYSVPRIAPSRSMYLL